MAEKAKPDFLKADFKTLFQKKPKNTEEQAVVDPNNIPVYKPRLPEVNLLPANIKEEYVAKELGGKFKIATISVVAIFAILGGVSFVTSNMNQGKIDAITSETSQINAQVQQLAPYELYRTQVQTKRTQLGGAMGNDIDFKQLNNNFNAAAASSGFEVRSIKIASGGGADSTGTSGNGACVNPDPFSSATGTGCITFGLAGNGNLANFFLELNKEGRGFINAYVPKANLGSASGETEKLVEGTVGFTDQYFSKKYSNLSAPIDTVLDPNAPAPTGGQPSAQPTTAPSDGNSVDVSKLPEVTNK